MSKTNGNIDELDAFFDFYIKEITLGNHSFEDFIAEYERHFVWEDAPIATAKLRTIFGRLLFQQSQTEIALVQLEAAEELLQQHQSLIDCEDFLCLNLAYQANCHRIFFPDKAFSLLDKVMTNIRPRFLINPLKKSNPYGTIYPEDIRHNTEVIYLLGLVGLIYAEAFFSMKNPMASEIKEAYAWFDMGCQFTLSALKIPLSANVKDELLGLSTHVFSLMSGVAASFEYDKMDDEFLDSLKGIDTLFDNMDLIETQQVNLHNNLESRLPIKVLEPLVLVSDYTDEQKDLVLQVLPTLNAEDHELELASCIFILEKINFAKNQIVEEDTLLSIMSVYMKSLPRGHPWIVHIEMFLGQVSFKENNYENSLSWMAVSMSESTILFPEVSFASTSLIVPHLNFLAEIHQEKSSNLYIFFKKLAFAYLLYYLNEIFDEETSFRDMLTLMDSQPDNLIECLISKGRIGEALELQSGFGTLMNRGNKRGLGSNMISFTEIENQQKIQLEKTLGNADIEFESKVDSIMATLTGIIGEMLNEEELLNQQTSALTEKLLTQKQVDYVEAGMAVIYHIPFSEQLKIIVITSEKRELFSTEVGISKLSETIKNFVHHLKLRENDGWAYNHKSYGQELYNYLIGNVIKAFLLDNKVRKILFAPTGVISFVPFNALYDGNNFLIEHFAIALFSEQAKKVKVPVTAKNTLALLGATFQNYPQITTLPAVKEELNTIRSIVSSSQHQIVDFREEAFNKDRTREVFRQSFNLVHIASHFEANPANTYQSVLQLGDGNTLTIAEILEDKKNISSINLLVFSACKTGFPSIVSNDQSTPAMIFHAHGIRSVIATLWAIADESTALLITKFYESLYNQPNPDISLILQEIQMKMLKGDYGEKYTNPFYWAAFMLSGESQFMNKK